MRKILVIEDEQPFREAVLELLEVEGFQAIGAENGQIGVRLAQENLPDLVLCDIQMPDIDGYSVLRELRQNSLTATLPFIFLTARGGRDELRQGMNLGADDYLIKPCTSAQLLNAIATRLNKQEALKQQAQTQLDDLRNNITVALPHELHTPLNGILGLSQVLIDEYQGIERGEILEIAKDIYLSAERLYQLTQKFLLYAELELIATNPARLQELQKDVTPCSKAAIASAAMQVVEQAGRQTDLQLDLEELSVWMAEFRLKKVVEELVDNACKFSLAGTPIRLSTTHGMTTQNQQAVVLSVSDQGRGIPSEEIANLGGYMQFERKIYEQQGAGLGLAIAKRLVELHQGELAIESILGKQTTVRVVLPLEKLNP
ncbi:MULTISPECIES: response regulator [Trichocoleus]|uniref:histidine kinase n=1 Tax=Trichocoleus desertorum GB2-A4 TaxID=2933944 RepID=A0ABV0J2T7_9CYAN|nr:response regulator [Trichocoleus sp. FACHB-46]MBD1860709.1 response regulator [Trichocoleus sp. FACHB-46]